MRALFLGKYMKKLLYRKTGADWLTEMVDVCAPVFAVLIVFAGLTLVDEFLLRCLGAAWGF